MRQGHPGPSVPADHRAEQKCDDARRFERDDAIPWPVVVDEVDGRVSFYSYWTHVPTLRAAIATLLARGGRGVLGEQRLPHPLARLADGWRAIARGLPQSADDMEAVAPGSTLVLKAGRLAKPVIGPWALTSRRWSRAQSTAALLVLGVATVALSLARTSRQLHA